MNIKTLCEKIELQPYIKERVLAYAEHADFETIDEMQKGYYTFADMYDTLRATGGNHRSSLHNGRLPPSSQSGLVPTCRQGQKRLRATISTSSFAGLCVDVVAKVANKSVHLALV